MLPTILDGSLTGSIRILLGVDSSTLPDAVLLDEVLGGAVEGEVLAQVGEPPYAERPPAEQSRIRQAIAYLTAAAALETGPVREAVGTTSERFSDQYTVQRQAPDLDAWANRLRVQAASALAPLVPRASMAMMFTLAPGRRGA